MKDFNENRFLIILLLCSLAVRLLIAPLYLASPGVPSDFYAYANAGEAVINGTLYVNLSPTTDIRNFNTYMGPYGPLLGTIFAPILLFSGRDYLLMKIPSILFDMLNVLLIYLIAKNLKGTTFAAYASIFYSFSYLVLFNSAAEGQNDNFELFWVLLAVYFIIRPEPFYVLSAISLGIAGGFVFIPFITLLPIVYYLYQTNKFHEIPRYLLALFATFTLILLPFYMRAGLNVLYPYLGPWIQILNWPPATHGTDGMSIPHLIKMLSYFFIFGSDKPYNTYQFPEYVATVSILVGLAFAFWYIRRFGMKDKKLEFIRNIFVLFFVGLVFFREYYFLHSLWVFSTMLILSNLRVPQKASFSMHRYEFSGILLVISGTLLHASIYKWLIDYTFNERILLLLGIIIVSLGTYLTFIKSSIRNSWTLIMLIGVSFNIMDARLLVLLGNYIPLLQLSRYAWGIYYFGTIILMIPAMFLLLKQIHSSTLSR